MSGGDLTFFSADLEQAARWYDALSRGELVTPAERNAAVVLLGASLDILADPVRTLGGGVVRLPSIAYAGHDRELVTRGVEVPVVGAVPIPAHWRAGGPAPASEPAWVRASDAERRTLYGAVQGLLERLAVTGEQRPAEGRGGTSGSGWLPVAIGAFAGVGAVVGALVLDTAAHEVGETARTWLRESAIAARYAQLLKAQIDGYKVRAEIAQRTGQWPPETAAEVAARTTPFNAGTSEPPRTTNQASADWWKRATDALPWVLGGTGLLALAIGGIAYAWKRSQTRDTDAHAFEGHEFEGHDEGDDTWTE